MKVFFQLAFIASCLFVHCDSSSWQLATTNLRAASNLQRDDPKAVSQASKAAAAEAKENTDTVYKRIMSAPEDLPRDAARDEQMIKDTFLPGYKPNVPILSATFISVMAACLWFSVYFSWIYKNDRVADSVAANERLTEMGNSESGGWLCKDRFAKDPSPDMVIVFPHPGHDSHKDSNDTDIASPRVEDVCRDSKYVKFSQLHHVISQDETPDKLNVGRVRAALMQDLHSSLPGLGFHFDAFASIDGDEIFFCISLEDKKMIEHYLVASHGELQLQPHIESKLGVGDCDDQNAMITPWVRYERSMVERLASCNIIENDDPRNLFITFKGKDPDGCLLSGLERFRTIYRRLSTGIDFDSAQDHSLINGWYPAHSLVRLQRLGALWGNFSTLTDLTFKQPITMINEYFGSRVSFIFAWNGVYCKALLALVPLALMWEFAGWTVPLVFSSISPEDACRQILGMTIIVLIWARIASNLYMKEDQFFMKQWGMNPDLKSCIIRSEFRGEMKPTSHDSNLQELQTSVFVQNVKYAVSAFITLLAVLIVAFAIFLWVAIFDGRMNLLASLCLTIQIKIFEFLFNILAGFLTEWENHKYSDSFYNSYLIKQFLFGFVNSYWAFFYLAIKQRHTEAGCPAGGCLWVMRKQLTITLIILSVLRIVMVLLQTFIVKFKLWMEDRALKKELGVEELPKRSFVEEQAKYADFGTIEQVQAMLQLVVPLGYVILFGGVAPITIPFAFAVFAVSLRAQGFLLCTTTKRPVPRAQYGIGTWHTLVTLLTNIAVLFAGFLLAAYGDMLSQENRITKMTVVIMFMFGIYVIWGIIDIMVPTTTTTVSLMGERRKRVMHKLMDTISEGTEAEKAERRKSVVDSNHFTAHRTATSLAIQTGQWDNIKKSSDIEEDNLHHTVNSAEGSTSESPPVTVRD